MTRAFLWYYGYGSEPESYLGGYSTRDEAIAQARGDYGDDVFTIVEAAKGRFYPPDAGALMGEMLERWADDDFGGEDYPEFGGTTEAVKAAEADLDAVLTAWFDRHRAIMPTPWCFAETRNEETFNLDRAEA